MFTRFYKDVYKIGQGTVTECRQILTKKERKQNVGGQSGRGGSEWSQEEEKLERESSVKATRTYRPPWNGSKLYVEQVHIKNETVLVPQVLNRYLSLMTSACHSWNSPMFSSSKISCRTLVTTCRNLQNLCEIKDCDYTLFKITPPTAFSETESK